MSDPVNPLSPASVPRDGSTDMSSSEPITPQPMSYSPRPEAGPVHLAGGETVSYTEVGAEQEMSPEVQEYMEEAGQDKIRLNEPIVINDTPVVHPPNWQPQATAFTVPVAKQTVLDGMKQPISSSWRWFSESLVRLIKKFGGNVVYSQTDPIE